MSYFEVLILSLIEGLTEFIPVSSTGHLILTSHFLNLPDTDFLKAFNVIIQFGAILAVVYLYHAQFRPNFSFYKKLIVGFLPAAVIGFLFKNKIDILMESTTVVAWALIIGGIIMILTDLYLGRKTVVTTTNTISDMDSLKIGFFQCFALIPGVSRSASTIIGAQALGFPKKLAAEFSFFLAVPTLTAATLYKLWKIRDIIAVEQTGQILAGILLSFVFAVMAIRFFISIVQKYGFKWFGVYRIILGFAVLFFTL